MAITDFYSKLYEAPIEELIDLSKYDTAEARRQALLQLLEEPAKFDITKTAKPVYNYRGFAGLTPITELSYYDPFRRWIVRNVGGNVVAPGGVYQDIKKIRWADISDIPAYKFIQDLLKRKGNTVDILYNLYQQQYQAQKPTLTGTRTASPRRRAYIEYLRRSVY
ncbi:MAG TPA: hypothetical protein ENG63_08290 [Candidatus Desulfofervidus auxilii]|uniref:Uncharacterized protein n=1 Tax=Desulfofervidus auxilii TaxID=1621989 RepID=A0A7C0U3F1_DESA2|nr:hypothetical protein [Candidatus Desulfofervidus auxilii]